MLRRFSVNFAILSIFLDILVISICLRIAVQMRAVINSWSFVLDIPGQVQIPGILYFLFPITYLIIFLAFAIYDGRRYLRVADEYAALSLAFIIASVSVAGILYLSFRDVSRALFLLFLLFTYIALILWRTLIRLYYYLKRDRPDETRRVVIIGTGPFGQRVYDQFQAQALNNIQVVGTVSDDTFPAGETFNAENIRAQVEEYQVTDVVIALPHSAYQHMAEIVRRLDDLPLHIWVALGFFDLALYQTAMDDFAGIPMLDLRATALSDIQRLVKRCFDILVGSLITLAALPIIGLTALAIMIDDGRPVFFLQRRAGENGKLFVMYKFRTMIKNAEDIRATVEQENDSGQIIYKRKNDPRVTHIGRFLRKTSIDELPQLYNVLQGTMSLVGPRPELPYLVERYQPWQRKRFVVPPGIVGWWQVTGRSDKPMHLHTEDDLYYINNYSIWLDIRILIRAAWVVIIGKGAY